MKISVIIPVYCVELYINACIASVVNQSFNNLEIILVDDGSTDKCPQICDEWQKKDNRITVIHKDNGGQGTARNAALDVATGDYVLFVDGDDQTDDCMIEKMVAASEDGSCDVVLCGIKVDNGFGIHTAPWFDKDFKWDNQELMLQYVRGNIFTGPVCKLFRRTLFTKIRFPSFRANEDAYIMHRLLGSCKTASVIHESLYTVKLRYDSTESKSFNMNKLHLLDCDIALQKYIKEYYPELTTYLDDKLAKDALYLLEKMYISKAYDKFPEAEEMLRATLIQEKDRLEKNQDRKKLLRDIDVFLSNRKQFVAKMQYKRICQNVKSTIKYILAAIKR